MDTPMHIAITEAATDWLTGDCANVWRPQRKLIAKASNYPDYFAAGEMKADEHAKIEPDWRQYTIIPLAEPTVAHNLVKPLEIRENYPPLSNYWVEKTYENLIAGNLEVAAKFAGTFSHLIGDTGQAAHVFDEHSLKRLMPHGNKRFIIHSTIEHVHGKITRPEYSQRSLAVTIPELEWCLIEELEMLKDRNMAEVIPIMQAILADDNEAARASASRSLTSCAELFSDFLFTIWSIAFKNDTPVKELDLRELSPLEEYSDMLFNYGIMLDRLPGKSINESLPINLGGENLPGIGLLAYMHPAHDEIRSAWVEYSIPASGFKYFTAEIGLNRGLKNETKAIFKVKLDGKTVFTSPAIGHDDAVITLKVPLGQASRLRLYVRDARPAPCDTKFFYPVFARPKLLR